METVKEYKCPCCNGAIAFDSEVQKMKCPYCDTEFEMETLKAYDEDLMGDGEDDLEWKSKAGGKWKNGEADEMSVYSCKSCGGDIIADSTTAATSCPYCGNPVVFAGQFKDKLRPDCVIPFKLDKEKAKAALKKHFKGKRLLPKVFADENHLDEIKGVYVPFWLFDADTESNMRYKGTKIHMWSDSKYNYTQTNYFSLVRGGNLDFERVPVDGSTKMADDLMESLEPYNFKDAVDFQTAYLAGYLADRYDVSSEESIGRANERIKQSIEDEFLKTTSGFTGVRIENSSVRLGKSSAKYALYPVWLLTTSWKNKNYIFAMNGQTGKFVGNLPMDKKAYFKWLFGIAGIAGAIIFALESALWLF